MNPRLSGERLEKRKKKRECVCNIPVIPFLTHPKVFFGGEAHQKKKREKVVKLFLDFYTKLIRHCWSKKVLPGPREKNK